MIANGMQGLGMPSPDQVASMAMPSMAMPTAAGVGMPPLNLDMGPSMPIATIGNTSTGGQNTATGNGAFVFKGAEAGSLMSGVQSVLPLVLIGGVVLFAIRRFT